MRNLLLLAPLLCLACSSYSTAPPQSPVVDPVSPLPADVGRVCVVRTSHLAQAVAFPTYDNGTLVGATKGPTHFCYLVAPGAHEIAMKADNEAKVALTVEPGHDYVLEQKLQFVFGIVNVEPAWASADRAKALLADSDYEVLAEVPGREQLPDPNRIMPAR